MKRDDKTTKELLDLLNRVKEMYPSLRMLQIIGNAFTGDGYYIEDKQLLAGLKRTYPEVK